MIPGPSLCASSLPTSSLPVGEGLVHTPYNFPLLKWLLQDCSTQPAFFLNTGNENFANQESWYRYLLSEKHLTVVPKYECACNHIVTRKDMYRRHLQDCHVRGWCTCSRGDSTQDRAYHEQQFDACGRPNMGQGEKPSPEVGLPKQAKVVEYHARRSQQLSIIAGMPTQEDNQLSSAIPEVSFSNQVSNRPLPSTTSDTHEFDMTTSRNLNVLGGYIKPRKDLYWRYLKIIMEDRVRVCLQL